MESMKVVSPEFVTGKRVLLRIDMDVPLQDGKILDDIRLWSCMDTLDMCLDYAKSVTVMGHIGRPEGKEDPALSVKPITAWIERALHGEVFDEDVLHILENLRFEKGEDAADVNYAKELAKLGDVYINEAFASHHPAASTTILPRLIPSFAGIHFAEEVGVLTSLKKSPKKPLIAIVGGAKVEDKYPAIVALSKFCDAVMVGGLLSKKIQDQNMTVGANVMLGKLSDDGLDLSPNAIQGFIKMIQKAKQVIWAGPVGKYEDPAGITGTLQLAEAVIASGAESIVGGGDTITALSPYLDKFTFVSTGGGAMLELLTEGTLPTIEALS